MIVLDKQAFRAQFPAYSNTATFTDVTVQMYFDMATNYVNADDAGFLRGSSRTLVLYLMTAHLLSISTAISAGQPLQALSGASEGSVSVTMVAPPAKNGWQWWLSSTPYGQQIWALLSAKSVGGFYIGGSLVRSGFRKTDGSF